MKTVGRILLSLGFLLGAFVLFLGLTYAVWSLRPNRAVVDRSIVLADWDVVKDSMHNSNTDFVKLNGRYWLAFVASPYHFGTRASTLHLHVADSPTGPWREVSSFKAPDNDIRDPKLAVIGGRLFLYGLENKDFKAEPYRTIYTSSTDGLHWDEFKPIAGMEGWLFWRALEVKGRAYATAYWSEHGKAALFGRAPASPVNEQPFMKSGRRASSRSPTSPPPGILPMEASSSRAIWPTPPITAAPSTATGPGSSRCSDRPPYAWSSSTSKRWQRRQPRCRHDRAMR